MYLIDLLEKNETKRNYLIKKYQKLEKELNFLFGRA